MNNPTTNFIPPQGTRTYPPQPIHDQAVRIMRSKAQRSEALAKETQKPSDMNKASALPTGRTLDMGLLKAAQELLSQDHRVQICNQKILHGAEHVALTYNAATGRAGFKGLMQCGNAAVCPVCAKRISEEKRKQLRKGIEHWQRYHGQAIMVTFKLRHHKGDRANDLINLLKRGFDRFKGGRKWMYFKEHYGIAHTIDGLEVTEGKNGWHPHLHTIFLLRGVSTDEALLNLAVELKTRWVSIVRKLGGDVTYEQGLDVRFGDDAVGDYIAKSNWTIAEEITKASSKTAKAADEGGRTPRQLLIDYRYNNDLAAGELFKEYAEAMKGRALLHYSKGCKAELGIIEDDDQTIAERAAEIEAQQAQVETVTLFMPEQWYVIKRTVGVASLIQMTERVSGDPVQIWAWLFAAGVPVIEKSNANDLMEAR